MVSFPDIQGALKMLEDLWGAVWGRRIWAILVAVVVTAIIAAGLLEIGGFWKTAYSEVRGWFSKPTATAAPPTQVAPQSGNCIVNGVTNYGNLNQTCK